jgi:type III restriction enzyme
LKASNPSDINICFTTIQKLHSDLTSEKENALTFEDFRKHRVVLIADEAHHMSVKTKVQGELFESWENTVERIFTQNEDNLLLEFTATHDYATLAMVEKYRNKVIIRYDLLQFRNDRFSKDVVTHLAILFTFPCPNTPSLNQFIKLYANMTRKKWATLAP